MGKLKRQIHTSLLAFRQAERLSQREAAELVGIDQAQWSRLENGRSGSRASIARRISDLTGVPIDALLNFGDDESGELSGVRQNRSA